MIRLFTLIFIISITQVKAQDSSLKNYFIPPLEIPLYLSGNFGEIRSGHFHAGLDIKTQGVEGHKVRAAADGYVSRVKVSLSGYGKAVYITHPNGYTTVYAHMQRFSDQINEFVKREQYLRKDFEVEIFPAQNSIPVKQGNFIGLSGNTGGSGGPHLHFEVRESASEIPVNPLLLDFGIADRTPPKLLHLGIYPLSEQSAVNGKNGVLYVSLEKVNGKYRIPLNQKIEVHGKVGFGIEAIDYLDGSQNKCGVYSIELLKNNVRVYYHELEKVPFHEGRYVNSHVDYYGWKKLNKRVQRSFIQPNNRLSVYQDLVNKGQFFFLTDTTISMHYIVKDVAGNTSQLQFELTSLKEMPQMEKMVLKEGQLFKYNESNLLKTDWFSLQFPPYVLYEDLNFTYEILPKLKESISPVFVLASLYTPLQSYINVHINLDSLPLENRDKWCAVSLTEKMKVLSYEGGSIDGNQLSFRTRSLGPYTIMVDTESPKIIPGNFVNGKDFSNERIISFKISDNLSGIATFNLFIDNNWELAEFDSKTGSFYYEIDKSKFSEKKSRKLKIEVSDKRGNTSVFQGNFIL